MTQQNIDAKLKDYLDGSSNNVVPQVLCAVIAEIRRKHGWYREDYYYATLPWLIIQRQHSDWTPKQAQHRAGNVIPMLEERGRIVRVTPGGTRANKNIFQCKFGECAPPLASSWCEIVFGSEEAAFSAFDGWRTFIEQAFEQQGLQRNWIPATVEAPSVENLHELADEEIEHRIAALRDEQKRRKLEILRTELTSLDGRIETIEADTRHLKVERSGLVDQIKQLEKN